MFYNNYHMISTGIQKLDDFLLGGISPGTLVDIFGANSTGKTQFLLQLCIICIKNGGKVLYIDTTGNFRPERIIELEKKFKFDSNPLNQITVSRVTNTHEQINSLNNLHDDKYSLILIDNVTDLFSYEYQKVESILKKNSIYMKYLNHLSKFAITKKIPIVMTNMIRTIDGKEMENMRTATNLFTHIKIHLSKNSSNYSGIVTWALNSETFSYKIHQFGLSDAEDI